MKQVDYLIVGCGLAGIAFSHLLQNNNKTFIVLDDTSQKSSTVAGGLYNPVVLKRFTAVWKSKEQLSFAMPFYQELEAQLNIKLDYKTPVLRLFNSIEEQNNWFHASDKPNLSEFLNPKIKHIKNDAISAEFGFGEVFNSGRIDTKQLIQSYHSNLEANGKLYKETLNYDDLEFKDDFVIYKTLKAKYIVCCEGFGIKRNPYFQDLPLIGSKGELLTIHAPQLNIDFVLKSSVFLIPLGNHTYRVGSTYEWEDKSNAISQKGRDELLNKLKTVINCPFDIIDQVAGIRPTVRDRRPLVGQHQQYKNMFILNGLGTRGVMIGPYAAMQLFNKIEHDAHLEPDLDINRFA